MNPLVELNLALILFLPWYAILACLYWLYPRRPRTLARWTFDVVGLTLALLATVASMHWSYRRADAGVDAMWPQILATSISYGVFLAVMAVAFLVRRWLIVAPWLARSAADGAASADAGTPR